MGEAGLVHGETSTGESLLPVHLPKSTLSTHGEVCLCHQWCLYTEIGLHLWRQGELLGVDLWQEPRADKKHLKAAE